MKQESILAKDTAREAQLKRVETVFLRGFLELPECASQISDTNILTKASKQTKLDVQATSRGLTEISMSPCLLWFVRKKKMWLTILSEKKFPRNLDACHLLFLWKMSPL